MRLAYAASGVSVVVLRRGVNGEGGFETVLIDTAYGPNTTHVCEPNAHGLRTATRRETPFQS